MGWDWLPLALGGIQNLWNVGETRKANKDTRDFSMEMYERQRRDALSDRDYNTPAEQMKRLKEAGLNPNLIYGSGAGSVQSQVRSSSPGSYRAEPAKIEGMSEMFKMMFDVMKTQADTSKAEAAARLADTQNEFLKDTMWDRVYGEHSKNVLRDTQQASELMRQLKIQWDTEYTEQKLGLDKALTEANIDLIRSRILQVVASTDVSNEMKRLLIEKVKQAEFEVKMNDIMLKGGTIGDVIKMVVGGILKK